MHAQLTTPIGSVTADATTSATYSTIRMPEKIIGIVRRRHYMTSKNSIRMGGQRNMSWEGKPMVKSEPRMIKNRAGSAR
jgi:hypothetical protein